MGVLSPGTGKVLGWARVPILIPIPAIFHPSLSPGVAVSGPTPFLGAVVSDPQVWRV